MTKRKQSITEQARRAGKYARLAKEPRPSDLPQDAECKTCANLPDGKAHSCPATQWLLDEPVCDDCAEGKYHYGCKPKVERIGSRGDIRRKVAA